MDANDTWVRVDRARREFVDLLDTLTAEQWDTPSLCTGWRVREVAAHTTMLLMGNAALLGMALRHPGGSNRLIREGSREIARRHTPDELVERVRRLVGNRRTFPGLGVEEVHLDILAHTLDVAVPLGLTPELPVDEVRVAADHVLGIADGRKGKAFEHLPLDRVRLVATDTEWSRGAGPRSLAR